VNEERVEELRPSPPERRPVGPPAFLSSLSSSSPSRFSAAGGRGERQVGLERLPVTTDFMSEFHTRSESRSGSFVQGRLRMTIRLLPHCSRR